MVSMHSSNWLTTETLRTQRWIHFFISVERTEMKNNQALWAVTTSGGAAQGFFSCPRLRGK